MIDVLYQHYGATTDAVCTGHETGKVPVVYKMMQMAEASLVTVERRQNASHCTRFLRGLVTLLLA